ncbi:MAG: LysE family transporter, partial [Cyanobacteria bacterium P01_A01_bin.3]
LFLQGIGIGIAIAAPVGVIGVLCIQRTLTQGRWIGFISGMGAATADALYGCIAGVGLNAIADLLVAQSRWLLLIGGGFLCYLGVSTFLQTPPHKQRVEISRHGALISFLSALLLTLTNPLTIFSFLGIFSGLGLGQTERNAGASVVLVLGVFVGSALWWLTLSSGVHYLSRRFQIGQLVWLNRISGVAIGVFGLAALWRFFNALYG